jgi:hypothetical protein
MHLVSLLEVGKQFVPSGKPVKADLGVARRFKYVNILRREGPADASPFGQPRAVKAETLVLIS